MRNDLKLGLICLALLAAFSNTASAQQATLNHNANLRRDASTSSPILAHLASGSRLTLVDATSDSGFYHVRTEDDQVGWIWSRFVTVSSNPAPAIAIRGRRHRLHGGLPQSSRCRLACSHYW
jgi:uncharacterized protein YgiM (DUF1202 family)